MAQFRAQNPKSPAIPWKPRTKNGEGGIRTQGRFASCSEARSSWLAKREKNIQEIDGWLTGAVRPLFKRKPTDLEFLNIPRAVRWDPLRGRVRPKRTAPRYPGRGYPRSRSQRKSEHVGFPHPSLGLTHHWVLQWKGPMDSRSPKSGDSGGHKGLFGGSLTYEVI